MPVAFHNFDFSYDNAKGKPVFVPSEEGRTIGLKLKALVEDLYEPEPFYWHMRQRGHVGALHAHRDHHWFARIDLRNFFYTVRRQRIDKALRQIGIRAHKFYSRWSTVSSPYGEGYVLPYGFVQSPILATLVMSKSALGHELRTEVAGLTVGVYLDDISVSSDDHDAVDDAFHRFGAAVEASGFELNHAKSVGPSERMALFNCDLESGLSLVTPQRQAEFHQRPRSAASLTSFEDYCASIAAGNRE